MKAEADVSVIIPTYNRANQTLSAVQSVLGQTLAPREILVVDDGSFEPIHIDDPRVRVLRHDDRRGAASARNTGIDAAKGEWVAFLDSDDRWLPNKLADQFEKLQADASPTAALCCCNVRIVDAAEEGGKAHNDRPPTGDLSEWILIHGNTAQTSGLMVPAAAARRIRFDETLPRHQDWDFFLRAAAAGLAISYIHEPLVLYDGSPRADRISSGLAAGDTLAWIDKAEGGRLVSPRAREAVLCGQVVAGLSARPGVAIWALACAALSGRLRLGPTLRWTLRSIARRLAA